MTTITAVLKSSNHNTLKDALVCAVRFASDRDVNYGLASSTAKLSWICETSDYDTAIANVQENIDCDALESFGVELVSIG